MSENIDDLRQTYPTLDGGSQTSLISTEGVNSTDTLDEQGGSDFHPQDEQVRDDHAPAEENSSPEDTAETFPLAYVQKLRTEAAEARVKAKRADDLAASLFTERVRATGRMADPTDLPFNAELLDDPDALSTAIDTLLGNKPHLASRTPRGDVGQGSTGQSGDVDLAALLRAGA